MHDSVARRLIEEIAPRAAGARIADAYAAGPGCLVLALRAPGGPHADDLFFVVTTMRALPLLFLTDLRDDVPAPRPGPGFERDLEGATIEAVRPGPAPATVDVRVSRTDLAGRTIERRLAIALRGRPGISLRDARAPDDTTREEPKTKIGKPTRDRADLSEEPTRDKADLSEEPARIEAEIPETARPTASWRFDRAGRLHVTLSEGEPDGVEDSRAFDTMNDAARFAFVRFWGDLELERRRGAARKIVARELKRKLRAVGKVKAEIEKAARADEYRTMAHLLLARKNEIRRGETPVRVLDFDNATTVTIDVDPALGAARNAEILFRRAKKAERSAERAPKRLGELEDEVAALGDLEKEIADAEPKALGRIEESLAPPSRPPKRGKARNVRARYRTYTVSGGWTVLVGKSNQDNDVLSHRIARPDDLWFHARQAAGSHVVLRREGKKAEPDRQAILETAAIAAYHSKGGRSSKVPVCYTEKRYVRKPRGSKSGLAVVTHEKVVLVEPKLPAT